MGRACSLRPFTPEYIYYTSGTRVLELLSEPWLRCVHALRHEVSLTGTRHLLEPWWVGAEARVTKALSQVSSLKQRAQGGVLGGSCRSRGPVPPLVTLESLRDN